MMGKLMAPLRVLERALAWLVVSIVRAYQCCLSPLLPPVCRFRPSCSRYMVQAIQKKGLIVGLLKGLWRIVRCNPLFPGGYDPVE
ncbi:MAG: membrane protein insertion efficiency factor YidD [Candidatus Brocadiaceae bacterium]